MQSAPGTWRPAFLMGESLDLLCRLEFSLSEYDPIVFRITCNFRMCTGSRDQLPLVAHVSSTKTIQK